MIVRRLPRPALPLLLLLCTAVPLLGASDHPRKFAGLWKGQTYAKGETRAEANEGAYTARHHTIELSLGADGSATVTQSPDAVSEATSFAHWSVSGGQLTLTFDSRRSPAEQDSQAAMTFTINHGELTPVTWDHTLWNAQGPPRLHRE